jgi:hypothetical protein
MPSPLRDTSSYWIAIVAVDALLVFLVVRTTGTALPEGAPSGTTTLTCSKPETRPTKTLRTVPLPSTAR